MVHGVHLSVESDDFTNPKVPLKRVLFARNAFSVHLHAAEGTVRDLCLERHRNRVQRTGFCRMGHDTTLQWAANGAGLILWPCRPSWRRSRTTAAWMSVRERVLDRLTNQLDMEELKRLPEERRASSSRVRSSKRSSNVRTPQRTPPPSAQGGGAGRAR